MGEGCSKVCGPAEVCIDGLDVRRSTSRPLKVVCTSVLGFGAQDSPSDLHCEASELTCKRFSRIRSAEPLGDHAGGSCARSLAEWCLYYRLGPELGSGQSAVAYKAFAVSDACEHAGTGGGFTVGCRRDGGSCTELEFCGSSPLSGPRAVTLKRFRNAGSVAFRQELKLLSWVGAHFHVLRMLEAFHGQEDVLVLEYCELGDMYEHYVRNGQAGIPEAHAAELARQLLLALGHLASRRVEHRDVKPENLMLYPANDEFREVPMLKLGDFGWATISVWGESQSVPQDGCGSLWYAPPELNPPVGGAERHLAKDAPLGSCDIWSLGVITFLLLCGHSPFHLALRIRDSQQREKEILRLAALAEINERSHNWQRLSPHAKHFCLALMRVSPGARLSIQEALLHPFVRQAVRAPRCSAVQDLYVPAALLKSSWRRRGWAALDGLQQLGWLAAAVAISEAEASAGCAVALASVAVRLHGMRGESSYIEELAAELAASARSSWFRIQSSVFLEVVWLAFRYLDVGMDGVLSAEDLLCHVLGHGAADKAAAWVRHWRPRGSDEDVLFFSDFCRAFEGSIEAQARLAGAMEIPCAVGSEALPEWARGSLGCRPIGFFAGASPDLVKTGVFQDDIIDHASGKWL